MPARRSLAESSDYEELVGAEVAATARASIENAIIVNPMNVGQFGDIMDDFGEALSDILQGFKTPAEAMDELQRKAP
jgi:ABC-type glycerol-3-phosphate transport system substrate-binding protein